MERPEKDKKGEGGAGNDEIKEGIILSPTSAAVEAQLRE
jgi:hypothetical protein